MSDLEWFFLTVGCGGVFGGLIALLVVLYFNRSLKAREQAVIDAEAELRQKARQLAKAADGAASGIRFDDEVATLLVEPDDTVQTPKVEP